MDAAPLLERHRVFHSHDPEETGAFLRRKDYTFAVPPRQAGQLDTRINAVYMPGMYLAYLHYGRVPVELRPSPTRSDYLVQLPLRGQLSARLGVDSVDCDPYRAAVASPARERCLFLSTADSARIQVALAQTALIGQLTALLGEPPGRPLDFAPAMELRTGCGRSFAQYVLMAVADLDCADSVLMNPITMSMFEQFIMTALLLGHPHTYTEALRKRERPIAPRDVKRAIEYLQAHLDSPVTLSDLVTVSGVPGRTLFKHFRDTKGVSPIRYLRNARFQKVREALMRAAPGDNVTGIATKWGFSHLGRFSVEYRQRFGESPSTTVRRSCRR